MPTSLGCPIFQFHTHRSHQVILWATPKATRPLLHCATTPQTQLNNHSPTQPWLADTTAPTFTVRCFSPHSTTGEAMDKEGSGLLPGWNWTWHCPEDEAAHAANLPCQRWALSRAHGTARCVPHPQCRACPQDILPLPNPLPQEFITGFRHSQPVTYFNTFSSLEYRDILS